MLKLYFLISLIVLTVSAERVTREAPNPESAVQTPEITLQNVITMAENGLQKLKEVILESFNATTTDELKGKAKERGETIISQLKTWADGIKTTTDEWKENVSVKELREIVDNAIEGFKTEHPQLISEAKDYVGNVTKISEKIVEQLKVFAQSDESKHIKELSEKLLETTKESFALIASKIENLDEVKPDEKQ